MKAAADREREFAAGGVGLAGADRPAQPAWRCCTSPPLTDAPAPLAGVLAWPALIDATSPLASMPKPGADHLPLAVSSRYQHELPFGGIGFAAADRGVKAGFTEFRAGCREVLKTAESS